MTNNSGRSWNDRTWARYITQRQQQPPPFANPLAERHTHAEHALSPGQTRTSEKEVGVPD